MKDYYEIGKLIVNKDKVYSMVILPRYTGMAIHLGVCPETIADKVKQDLIKRRKIKMSKGLEALKDLREHVYATNEPVFNRYDIIEKELKEKETQDDYIKMLEDRIDNLETSYLRNKKALEIIRKYIRVDKPFGSACYIYLNDESEMILQEEYDLLKEVLL